MTFLPSSCNNSGINVPLPVPILISSVILILPGCRDCSEFILPVMIFKSLPSIWVYEPGHG